MCDYYKTGRTAEFPQLLRGFLPLVEQDRPNGLEVGPNFLYTGFITLFGGSRDTEIRCLYELMPGPARCE
jgi:hypothetical protein